MTSKREINIKKRLKKKIDSRYDLLKRAKRQMYKQKGIKYLAYELVPMGKMDKLKLMGAGYTEYSNATHWFLEIAPMHHHIRPYAIQIYPTTDSGRSDTYIHLQVNAVDNPENLLPLFNEMVEDMKNDRFWGTDYAILYE